MKTKLHLLVAVAVAALTLAGCPPEKPDVFQGNVDDLATCEASEQCSLGNICVAGNCVLGTCDPLIETACDTEGLEGPFCCKPWELCSTLSFNCENDPNVIGIGCEPDDVDCTPCERQNDCAGGQFCSAATCLDAAGRDPCSTSFECADGERCDRTQFLCVPDRGACQFCGQDFPELCCEDGQNCSEQTGFCVEIPDAECTEDTDCNPGQFCNAVFSCVQCEDDGDCGPGLLCDEGEGECFADNSCASDAECNGNQRCAPATSQCVLAECSDDDDCLGDSRLVCDLGVFTCELPDPVCDDDLDEPNDDTSEPSEVEDFAFAGYLCREDTDILSFPVIANKRYTATVDFGGSGQAGIIVTMLGNELIVESTAAFAASDRAIQVVGVTGPAESGTFYVKIQGNNDDADHWDYTVSIAEEEPSQPADCTPAGQAEEPNNSFETATDLVLGASRTFSRCGTGDVDFYKVTVPALNGVQVTVSNFANPEGNINVELFKAPNNLTGSKIDSATNVNNIEIVDGAEVSRDFWIRVFLGTTAGAVTDQTYRVSTVAVPRDPACSEDTFEDDGSFIDAEPLTLTGAPEPSVVVTDIIRCNPQDKDFFRFTMPPNLGGVVQLSFIHSEGDMKLELFRASDTTTAVDTSNTSNTNSEPDEQVEVPGSAIDAIEYFAVASLNGTGGITAQRYTLTVQTFDDSQCIASEPSGGDDAFQLGRCIGNFEELRPDQQCVNDGSRIAEPMVSASTPICEAAAEGTVNGCGRMCGNGDSDWFRVGILNNDQILHAILDYDPLEGELGLARGTLNATTGAVTETASTDTDHDGHLELSFAAPRNLVKEYGVRVKPVGTTGHQVQRYSLRIEVGAECPEDVNDIGTAANETPAAAELIRTGAAANQGTPFTFDSNAVVAAPGLTRCTNDVDVYEFISHAGETVTVDLDQLDPSPAGMQVELGTRPAVLTTPAVLIESTISGQPPIVFDNPETQQLYVTVRAPTGTIVTGPYRLVVTTTP